MTPSKDLDAALDACWEMGRTGRSTEGLVDAQVLLIEARRRGDVRAMARAQTSIGWFCLQLGQADDGLDCTAKARKLFDDSSDRWGTALSGAVYSWLLLELGLSDLGFDAASAALAAAKETDDMALRAFAMSCRGMALMLCREDRLAQSQLNEALELAEQAGDACTIALNLTNLGYSSLSLAELAAAEGRPDDARALMERGAAFTDRAVEAARGYGDLWNLRLALCNGAEAHALLGDIDTAKARLAEWDALSGHIGLREEAHYLDTKGLVLMSAGDPQAALAVCQQAAAVAGNWSNLDMRMQVLRRLSDVEAALGRFEAALAHHRAFHDVFVVQIGALTGRRAHVLEMQMQNEALRARTAELEIEVMQDPLTGLFNRRAFERDFAGGGNRPYCVAIVDIDRFKSVNDRFTHIVGDAVLRRVAKLLSGGGVKVYRMGGEEFGLLLEGGRLDKAQASVEQLRRRVENARWDDLAEGLAVTFSAGVASSAEVCGREILAMADRRLYLAKSTGRNRVIAADAGRLGLSA